MGASFAQGQRKYFGQERQQKWLTWRTGEDEKERVAAAEKQRQREAMLQRAQELWEADQLRLEQAKEAWEEEPTGPQKVLKIMNMLIDLIS